MFGSSHDEVPVLIVLSCGVVCAGGYLLTFALSRRLVEGEARPMIAASELIKPLACGMLLGLLILVRRLTGADVQAAPQFPALLSALLSVGLVGVCGGGWTARPRAGRTGIAAADLVRRLCIAGDTHEDATARVAVRLALAAGYATAGASDLLAAASLHDVGHAGIPKAILDKGECLDAAERRVLQNHTRIGHRMLARSHEPMLELAADIALHHHENWDGSGYPAGLAEERIPLTSRVTALAERFDRLLDAPAAPGAAPQPAALDRTRLDQAVSRLRAEAGVRFDPRLVALLLADLPGMVAARDGGAASAPRGFGAKPVPVWLRPDRFRAMPGGITI